MQDVGEEELVQLVYDAAESSSGESLIGWQHVLESVARHLGADNANIFLVDPRQRVVETCVLAVEPSVQQHYHQHFQARDPRFALASQRPDEVFSDMLAFDRRTYVGTEIYNDYLLPNGVAHSLFVAVQYAEGQFAPQAYFRAPELGPFLREDVERLQRLVPHLARALRFRQLLGAAESRVRDLQQLLDAGSLPLAVLDDQGIVLCMSRRAHALIDQLPALKLKQQRLGSSRPQLASALRAALKSVCALADSGRVAPSFSAPATVEVEREGRAAITLLYLPLRFASKVREQTQARGRVLIAFHDPELVTRLDPRIIARIFHLTPTEAELAAALGEGRSLLRFALERGCAEQTARVHLKRLLEKTRTHRQPDLVRLLLSSSALQATAFE